MKTPMIAMTALFALGTAAAAQTATLQDVDSSTMIQPWNVSADDADDMNVYDAQGFQIGEVEKVVGTSETEATALIVDFVDMMNSDDDNDRVVPLEAVTFADNMLTLPADADVAGLQAYDGDD